MVVSSRDNATGVNILFSKRRDQRRASVQREKLSGLFVSPPPNVEVHMLDSVSRAVFQFRMPRTVAWLRSVNEPLATSETRVFHFSRFSTVGLHTRGNVPTLWQVP